MKIHQLLNIKVGGVIPFFSFSGSRNLSAILNQECFATSPREGLRAGRSHLATHGDHAAGFSNEANMLISAEIAGFPTGFLGDFTSRWVFPGGFLEWIDFPTQVGFPEGRPAATTG